MADPIPTSAFQNDEDDDEDSWFDETIRQPFSLLPYTLGSPLAQQSRRFLCCRVGKHDRLGIMTLAFLAQSTSIDLLDLVL
jgi:hypothetical protein